MALYWLAASDPDMEIPEADLGCRPKEELIEGAKDNFTDTTAEIRRAHNDGIYGGITSRTDQPSCVPGTFGRLVHSVIYNPAPQMVVINPVAELPAKLNVFVINKFKELPERDQLDIANYMSDKFIMFEEDAELRKKYGNEILLKFEGFAESLRKGQRDFIRILREEYGEMFDFRLRQEARRQYDGVVNVFPNVPECSSIFNRIMSIGEELNIKAIKSKVAEGLTEEGNILYDSLKKILQKK